MTRGKADGRRMEMDDLGGVVIAVCCLVLIGLGKETATVTSVLLTVTGFMFGKHTRKGKK